MVAQLSGFPKGILGAYRYLSQGSVVRMRRSPPPPCFAWSPPPLRVGGKVSRDRRRSLSSPCREAAVEGNRAKRGGATVMFGDSPVLGRAQGWRFAPPPLAASALTPSAHRAFWPACGRRNAPPGGRAKGRSCGGSSGRVPGLIARQHGVEDDDQLAHAGDDGDLGFFAPGDEALVVGFEHRIVLGGRAHGRHVEEVAQLAAPPLMQRAPLRSPLSSS